VGKPQRKNQFRKKMGGVLVEASKVDPIKLYSEGGARGKREKLLSLITIHRIQNKRKERSLSTEDGIKFFKAS